MRPAFLMAVALLMACGVETAQVDEEPAGSTRPIAAEAHVWTWAPFSDAVCANGDTTGFAVNTVGDSGTLVLYLQGGGACWDGASCVGPFASAVKINSAYRYEDFKNEENLWGILPLERDNPDNPFKDAHLAFVPYCTGDVHVGTNVATHRYLGQDHTVHHVGALNLDAFLKRLVPTFPNVTRVVLAGASAGGFGAAANQERVQLAFPNARVDVLDDSGPLMQPTAARMDAWKDAWHISLPADCADCDDGPDALRRHLAEHFPEARVALSVFETDGVLSHYTGLSKAEFSSALDHVAGSFEGSAHRHVFLVKGSSHVVLANPGIKVRGTAFKDWLKAFAEDSADWSSLKE